MNPVQQVLFNIFVQYAKACEQLGLTYFAFGGTLLGAVRHQGFIPWDDDMDLAMPRKDYDQFIAHGQEVLPDYLLLQASELENDYPLPFAKIRDTRTTMIEARLKNATFNQGCWIDIFPLDSIDPSREMTARRQRKRQLLMERCLLRYEPWPPTGLHSFLYRCKLFLLFPSRKKAVTHLRTFYSGRPSNSGYLVHNNGRLAKRLLFMKEWFKKPVGGTFENYQMFLPNGYLEVLENMYGDWRDLPPDEKRTGTHDCIIDLEKPHSATLQKGQTKTV